jgi:gas vesicle protein
MKTATKVLIALGIGLAAGAIAGILFAPDKGSETRKKMADAAGDYAEKLKKMKDSVSDKIREERKTGVEEA